MSSWFRESSARGRRAPTAGPAEPSPRVDRVLDSLRAPASPRDLLREDDAVVAFHRARLEAAGAPTGSTRPRAARTGVKAALASAAAVALLSTGAAFAASGHAPWSHAPVSGTASSDHTSPTHRVPPSHSVPTDDPSETAGDGPDAHALRGLCRAYLVGAKADHGHALDSRAFVALALAAGGADHVVDFCTTLPPRAAGHSHPAHPTHPARPSQAASPTRPTQAASPTHPAKPSPSRPSHPTHSATPSHPHSSGHPVPPSHPSAPRTHPTAHSHP